MNHVGSAIMFNLSGEKDKCLLAFFAVVIFSLFSLRIFFIARVAVSTISRKLNKHLIELMPSEPKKLIGKDRLNSGIMTRYWYFVA